MNKAAEYVFAAFSILALALFFEFWYVTVPLVLVWVGYSGYARFEGTEHRRERRARKRTQQLYEDVTAGVPDIDPEEVKLSFGRGVYGKLPKLPDALEDELLCAMLELYDRESFHVAIPKPPVKCDSMEGARYRDYLSDYAAKANNPAALSAAQEILVDAFNWFIEELPPLPSDTGTPWSHIALADLISGDGVQALIAPFYSEEAYRHNLFTHLRKQLDRNLCEASGLPYTHDHANSDKAVLPATYQGHDIANVYLQGTPLLNILSAKMPICVDDDTRFAHTVLFASTGHGKTQTLQSMILDDLDRVAKGECSVVVMDSQEQLIDNIAHLKIFAKGQPLDGKLLLIDPKDVHYPIALNLFDANVGRIADMPLVDQERMVNSTIELYDYVLASLLGAELTQKQGVVFRYFTRLMLSIPDATLHTFIDIMRDDGFETNRKYVSELPKTAQDFFNQEFAPVHRSGKSDPWKQTKTQIIRRIHGILEKGVLERMFSHPKSKVDLYTELQEPKVILISTSKDLLKESGTEFFGRFFLALLAQASQERLGKRDLLPAFCYIDEAHDYVDRNLAIILSQARKTNMGFTIASQGLYQYPSHILPAVKANTAIKMGGKMPDEGKQFAAMVRADPQFFINPPKFHYATLIDGVVNDAVTVSYQFGRMEAEERMCDDEYDVMLDGIREKYATYYSGIVLKPDDVPDTSLEKDIDPLADDGEDFF